MRTNNNINNLDELNLRLTSLKVDYKVKETMLKTDLKAYVHQFTPGNLIKRYATPSAFLKMDDKLNISSKLMSLVLPLVMNSTLFRGSGFITKAIVGLATSKFGKKLDAEHLSAIYNSVTGLFKKSKQDRVPAFADYGIPPDSETY